jgi:hypothetical protein
VDIIALRFEALQRYRLARDATDPSEIERLHAEGAELSARADLLAGGNKSIATVGLR